MGDNNGGLFTQQVYRLDVCQPVFLQRRYAGFFFPICRGSGDGELRATYKGTTPSFLTSGQEGFVASRSIRGATNLLDVGGVSVGTTKVFRSFNCAILNSFIGNCTIFVLWVRFGSIYGVPTSDLSLSVKINYGVGVVKFVHFLFRVLGGDFLALCSNVF